MEKIHNKLVRDNIPDIIEKSGREPIAHTLDDKQYKAELEKKLYEEYEEMLKTETSQERIEELADIIEIVASLAKLEGKTLEDVMVVAKEKTRKRGGFDKKIFLERVISKDD